MNKRETNYEFIGIVNHFTNSLCFLFLLFFRSGVHPGRAHYNSRDFLTVALLVSGLIMLAEGVTKCNFIHRHATIVSLACCY